MNRKQQADITTADEYELEAATCLALGMAHAAEALLTWADGLHEKADKDEEASAA